MNYTIDRKQIKENAKAQLGGKIFGQTWIMALLAFLIYTVITGTVASIGSFIPVIGSLVPLVIAGPLGIGLALVFMKLARNHNNVDIADLFTSFSSRFGKDFLLGLLIAVFTALWTLLFIVPGIVKSYAYSMAYYISLDNPEWDWKACIDESKRITNGHKWELFVLDLSFIGWYFVGSLCFGIGTLWVSAYHYTAKANYYEALKANSQPVYTAPYQTTEPVQPAE
ncbi:MAG: DUF975 family protein [Ruminococcus sp.]|nr:DUF975 family protein [Ruminococcus sp.]MBQ7134486.1 DUF975 family protein [Ruminococcus sp.]